MEGQTLRRRAVLRGDAAVLAVLFVVYALVAVTAMAALVPPFCNADELAHFRRAEQVAAGVLVAAWPGGMVDPAIGDIAARFDPVRTHPEVKVEGAMVTAADGPRWGRPVATGFPNTAIYPPTGYLAAAASILAGQHAGWRIAATLTASRLVNGMVCIAASGAAIALSGSMAVLLFTILCLPMSLALFASVSQDGALISAAALAAAALVRAAERGAASRRWIWLLCVCLCVVAMGRPPYLPLAAVLLTMGFVRWWWRLACAACVAGAVAAWSVWCAGPIMAETIRPRGIDPAGQAGWLLGHPALLYQVPAVVLAHQWADGLPYLRQFVGVLGSLDVPLPGAYTVAAYGTIVLALVVTRPVIGLVHARVLMPAAILMSIVAIFGIQYLTWTQIGSHLVEGVQGRYFLPLALFVPLCLPARAVELARWRRPAVLIIALFPALSIIVALHALMRRYYS